VIAGFAARLVPLAFLSLLVSGLIVLCNLQVMAAASQKERRAAFTLVIILTLMLPISTIRSETAVYHYVTALTTFGVAFVFTRNLANYLNACRYSLLASQLFVLAYLARTGLSDFPLERILPDSSSNGVTSYLIVLQATYSVIHYLRKGRAPLPTACVTLFIAFVGWGRGSLLAAAAILAFGLLTTISSSSRWGRVFKMALLAAGICTALVVYRSQIETLVAGTKIGLGVYDESRLTMIEGYLGNLNAIDLWAGASYRGTIISTDFNGNPHNSFIRAHHIFGLPYLLFVLVLPLYLVNPKHARTVRLYAGAMWLVVMFRAFTEPILFPTLFDFFYFASCFALSQTPPLLASNSGSGPRRAVSG
jgi:hypothetical protein